MWFCRAHRFPADRVIFGMSIRLSQRFRSKTDRTVSNRMDRTHPLGGDETERDHQSRCCEKMFAPDGCCIPIEVGPCGLGLLLKWRTQDKSLKRKLSMSCRKGGSSAMKTTSKVQTVGGKPSVVVLQKVQGCTVVLVILASS